MPFTFRCGYAASALILFVIEVLIAVFVRDSFVRPFLGDVIVILLIYCFVRAFFRIGIGWAMGLTLAFAFAIEGLQYLNFAKEIGLEHNKIATAVLGNSFSWLDIMCYVAGAFIGLGTERFRKEN